jgi:hypothetical protein
MDAIVFKNYFFKLSNKRETSWALKVFLMLLKNFSTLIRV